MKTIRQQGFTIVELMITVGIAGIIIMIAAPNMSEFVKNERLTTATNTLISDFLLARSKAVEMNQPVIVCASSDQSSCSNTSTFDKGWIVGIDVDNSGSLDNADTLIKVQQELSSGISISDGGLKAIVFNSRGFTPDLKTTDILSICDSRKDDNSKAISFSPTGRISRGGSPSC